MKYTYNNKKTYKLKHKLKLLLTILLVVLISSTGYIMSKNAYSATQYRFKFNTSGAMYTTSGQLYVNYSNNDNNSVGKAYKTGYNFLGWYTAESGGVKVFDSDGFATYGDYWVGNTQSSNTISGLTISSQYSPDDNFSGTTNISGQTTISNFDDVAEYWEGESDVPIIYVNGSAVGLHIGWELYDAYSDNLVFYRTGKYITADKKYSVYAIYNNGDVSMYVESSYNRTWNYQGTPAGGGTTINLYAHWEEATPDDIYKFYFYYGWKNSKAETNLYSNAVVVTKNDRLLSIGEISGISSFYIPGEDYKHWVQMAMPGIGKAAGILFETASTTTSNTQWYSQTSSYDNRVTSFSINNTSYSVIIKDKNLQNSDSNNIPFAIIRSSSTDGESSVTFNPQGGTFSGTTNNTTKQMKSNTNNNSNPGIPTRSGYSFNGWYTKNSGGDQVFNSSGNAFNNDYWYVSNVSIPTGKNYYTQYSPSDHAYVALDSNGTATFNNTNNMIDYWDAQWNNSHANIPVFQVNPTQSTNTKFPGIAGELDDHIWFVGGDLTTKPFFSTGGTSSLEGELMSWAEYNESADTTTFHVQPTVFWHGKYNNYNLYARWSKTISSLTKSISPTSYIYDGTAKCPPATVKDGSTQLTKDVDYSTTCSSNTNVGTASETISGKNAYNSTTKAYYTNSSSLSFYINNATLTFDATTNGGTGGGTIYTRKDATEVYTGIRNSTTGSIPSVTPPTGYSLSGWYTESSGGTKILNPDGTFTGTAVANYTNTSSWAVTTNKTLYAQYTSNVTEAYAEFDSSNGQLRIFRDVSSSYTDGQVIGTKTYYTGLEAVTGTTRPKWYSKRSIITSVVIEDEFKPKTAYYLFGGCSNLSTITGILNLNTSQITNMEYMFDDCSSLINLDVTGLDTSNVTTMFNMFSGCSSLTSLDLSNFDTDNLMYINNMFKNCSNLITLDISNFNTSNITDMSYIFYGCSSLTSLDLSSFDTSNVTDMYQMFYNCSSLTELDLSNFNTSSATRLSNMFQKCSGLTSLNLSNFNTSGVENFRSMFLDCSNLTSVNLSSFNTSNATDMGYMFSGCSNLTTLDLTNFDTSNVPDMQNMFSNTTKLRILKLGTNWKFNSSLSTGLSKSWIRDGDTTLYTASQLVNSYNGSTMAGTYRAMQQLTISEKVKGALANINKNFDFTINVQEDGVGINSTYGYTGTKTGNMVFTNGNATFVLKHGDNISTYFPYGVNYTITQDSDGYTLSSSYASGTLNSNKTATFTDTLNGTTPTGIFQDLTPFILLITFGVFGIFLIRKFRYI